MGCVTTQPQLAVIQALVDDAVARGATLHIGGTLGGGAAGAAGPLFYPPTVLSGVTPEMRIAREEVFGPVLSILRVPGDSDAAAAALANATPFGLGATVWSRDPARAHRLASQVWRGWRCGCCSLPRAPGLRLALPAQLRSGMVGVNAFGLGYISQVGKRRWTGASFGPSQRRLVSMPPSQDMPFGGVGASGYGRFGGPEGLRACCLERSVVVDWALAWPWPLAALARYLAIPTHVPAAMQYPTTGAAVTFTQALADLQVSIATKVSMTGGMSLYHIDTVNCHWYHCAVRPINSWKACGPGASGNRQVTPSGSAPAWRDILL